MRGTRTRSHLIEYDNTSANHKDKYFELKLAVDPEAVEKSSPPSPSPPSGGGNNVEMVKKRKKEWQFQDMICFS
jgi:hypothetical protein